MSARKLWIACAVGLIPAVAGAQAPKATKLVISITEPSSGSLASIRIDKKAIVKVKALPGNVQFLLKVSGVVDGADMPVTSANHTFQVDVLVGGVFTTESFVFDLVAGKNDSSTARFVVTNGALGIGGSAGDPVEIRAVRLLETGTGHTFGVGGLTLK